MAELNFVVLLIVLMALFVVGVLLISALLSVARLRRRVETLERCVGRQAEARHDSVQSATSETAPVRAPVRSEPDSVPVASPPVPPGPLRREPVRAPEKVMERPTSGGESVPSHSSPPPLPKVETAERRVPSREPARTPSKPDTPDPLSRAFSAVKRWFTEGNVPVKIGVLVLFAGVAALLKYVSDQGWLVLPIELRLAAVAAAALGALVFAWSKRERHRAFALSLQGGAIGILLLTIFAAFKLYGLMPSAAAFGLSVVLVFAAGVLAVLQNARALAVFAILAGFLAPIWLSNNSGNHVALFSYYAILNAAIFGIAWKRTWHGLNLLGFVFTFGIGTFWGVMRYLPEAFVSTEPFLILFFGFYLLIPVLHVSTASSDDRIGLVDRWLIFATPLVVFLLQAGMLRHDRMLLAFSAVILAAVYIGLAAWLRLRRSHASLIQSFASLAIGFATLAVPLALSARVTACVFAVEGAVLIWLGLRQRQWLYRFSGVGLQLAAAVAFVLATVDANLVQSWVADRAILNATFVSVLLITLSAWAGAWGYRQYRSNVPAALLYVWGMVWWIFNGLNEIHAFVPSRDQLHAVFAFVSLSGWLAAEVCRKRPAIALGLTSLLSLAAALPIALIQSALYEQPFAGNGVWAWLVYGVLGIRSLWCLRNENVSVAKTAQLIWWLVWPLLLSLLLAWLGKHFDLDEGWQMAGWILPWCLVLVMSLFRWNWIAVPLGSVFDSERGILQGMLLLVASFWWLFALRHAGGSAPLPWIPLLNPLELMQIAVLVLALRIVVWKTTAQGLTPSGWGLPACAGFVLISMMTLRTVHHWSAEPWSPSLLSSVLAQTSLTVVWSILGVLGWVIGSRRGQRAVWLAGAVLMAIVLGKLALIDRSNLGNVLGIASFIAYGMLCVIVGYLAPAPPRSEKRNES